MPASGECGEPHCGRSRSVARRPVADRASLFGAYQASGSHAVSRFAGWVGLALALVAFYGSEALLLEDLHQRTVLPLFRRRRARVSIEGNLADPLERVAREAGVRQQL